MGRRSSGLHHEITRTARPNAPGTRPGRARNPVLFATGPDASVNSLGLKLSGIDKNFQIDGPGKIEKDPATGEPTGILRNCTRFIKVAPPADQPKEQDQERRLIELFKDYNSVGLTAVIDRDAYAPAIGATSGCTTRAA